jgi:hypothetical protein
VTTLHTIIYNNSMRLRFALLMMLLLKPTAFAQPTKDDRRSNDVPLEKLKTGDGGMIVVTPDLRKALDALGAGSVVLSAEKYQELMKAQEKKPDKTQQEILFARCQITGEVKTIAGREMADLVMELEFRTETPNAVVPIPCKGLRMTSANVNGQPPVWGPDPERWSVHLKEPQLYRLRIQGLALVSRTGVEKKLQLERLPASAITSVELKIAGPASNALVLGYGSVPVAPPVNGISTLSAPALGVLSSLELTWQASEATATNATPTIEGDIRIALSELQASTEVRLKPVPFTPITLPWRIRIPANSQQLRVELLRSESQSSEPLIATKQQDGTYLINSPYPLAPVGFTQMLLRWQQALPDADAVEAVPLGTCQVLEPTNRVQSGTITINQPDQPTVLLRPVQVQAEKDPFDFTRDVKRSQRYRYTQQPASLEAVALPAAQVRGIVEARVTHSITAQQQDWQLVTIIDVVRSSRGNLAQLELTWPSTWPINRRLLFSPIVKDIEQDTKAEKLKIILDGKQPGQFQLRLESILPENPALLQIKLPELVSVAGQSGSRRIPLELLLSSEMVQQEAAGVELQLVTTSTGLSELGSVGGNALKQFQVRQHPAIITLRKTLRLPKYSSSLEMAVGQTVANSRQRFTWRSGTLPRQVTVLVPRVASKVQFHACPGEQPLSSPLVATLRANDAEASWKQYVVELPGTIEDCKTLLCVTEQEAKPPLLAPLARLEETIALHEGDVPVSIKLDAGLSLSLPAEASGWKLQSNQSGRLQVVGMGLQSFLVLEKGKEQPATGPTVITDSQELVTPMPEGYQIESKLTVAEVQKSQWQGSISAPSDAVQIIGWKLDQQVMPRSSLVTTAAEGNTKLTLQLPLERLHTPASITIAWQYQPRSSLWREVPGLRWQGMGSHRWLLATDPAHWLVYSSAEVSPWTYITAVWKPIGLVPGERVMELVDSTSTAQLRYITAPRYLVLLIGSLLGFLLFTQLKGMSRVIILWCLVALLAVLYLVSLPTATLFLWSIAPGLVLAVFIQLARQRLFTPRTTPVFQRTGVNVVPRLASTGSSLGTSIPEAPTILANPR